LPKKTYTIAQKSEQGRLAWEYSARGYGVHRIAKEMGIAVNTVQSRLDDYEQAKRQLWHKEDVRAVTTYEEVIQRAWERYEKVQDNSLNASGLLNTIITARKAIDDITGAKAPEKSENRHEHNHRVDYSNLSTEELREKVAERRNLRESGGLRASIVPSRN
jgi:hypothetical protein